MFKAIQGSRAKSEADLLQAIWTDATPRYKVLMKKLYPAKPELQLIKNTSKKFSPAPKV